MTMLNCREQVFAEFLVETFGEDALRSGPVLDIAGGRGDLSFELQMRRGIPTTLVDPRPMKLRKEHHKLLRKQRKQTGEQPALFAQVQALFDDDFVQARGDLVRASSVWVGLHPDQAAEPIIRLAMREKKPFAVVPCCVFSKLFPERRTADGKPVTTYLQLIDYFKRTYPGLSVAHLPVQGRNLVLFCSH
eukprot:TRINITY_DN50247_c0_g2_i1.p3 TRINITY_DN50247_c0_g2~~TRINITY_DN50247_c0_g2_i1.p3  ORF type:complete len:190 (-),score=79.73 TRINITY_DN50247_c0_g2_i1:46-615(-)